MVVPLETWSTGVCNLKVDALELLFSIVQSNIVSRASVGFIVYFKKELPNNISVKKKSEDHIAWIDIDGKCINNSTSGIIMFIS